MNLIGAMVAAHALAAAVWVGGMAFAHFCLRPAVRALEPSQRLPLMATALGRFFPIVWVAILVLLASGYAILLTQGFGTFGVHVHLMQSTGTIMMLLFAHLWFAPWRRMKRAVAASDWPAAGRHLDQVRLIVTINLWLGAFTVLVGAGGRWI